MRHQLRRFPRRSKAITPIVATILLIAVTVTAGAGVFSYVNSQAGVSEKRLGDSTASYLNFVNEKFLTVNANFSATRVTIWFYNNGNFTTTIKQIWIWNTTRSLYVAYNSTVVLSGSTSYTPVSNYETPALPLTLPKGSTVVITLRLPGTLTFNDGRTYYIQSLAAYGNTYLYFQAK